MTFTTRPELLGTFGMVSTTHWLASQAGMKMLEAGGTAADAAVAAGFVLNVVEPHLNGPLGEVPALVRPAGADTPLVLCGQGTAPERATVDHYRSEGLDIIPGSGLLAAVTPGAFDAWMLMLRDHGRLPLAEVLAPAIHYAEHGHPMLAGVASAIAGLQEVFRKEWPSSAPVWLPGGKAPEAGALFRNPDCAAMWRRLVAEGQAAGPGREAQIEAARRAHASGFVAEAIDDFLREACVLDATGETAHGRAHRAGHGDVAGHLGSAPRRRSRGLDRLEMRSLDTGPGAVAGPPDAGGRRPGRDGPHRGGVRAPRGRGAETGLRGSRVLLRRPGAP
jgi:gamma-glutamyltranspeptidase/glutathione hydrolase